MRKIMFVFVLFAVTAMAFAGSEAEAAASATRGKYLAGQGVIIPSGEVHINSYIAAVDYGYPKPEEAVSVTLATGNQQLSTRGGEELIHIGIQAGELEFDELPPMNLAFVIDKSGSMSAADKMEWVKDAFDIFIDRVRDIDYVSLIVFDSDARVVYRSTSMDSRDKRMRFRRAVHSTSPGGGTNLVAGLRLGYQQVMANYRSDYTNRVLFLTDGCGESAGILKMAEEYKDIGVNVSTIGVGQNFDLDLMVKLAKAGGGSARFISDREEMEEIFGSELDRMVVPAVRDLKMELSLPAGYKVLETWGYNHEISGNTVKFSQPTLHHRDYETILVKVMVPPVGSAGRRQIAAFDLSFNTIDGDQHTIETRTLSRTFVDDLSPVTGYSNALVLQSGTMLHFAEGLIRISDTYYSCNQEVDAINAERNRIWDNTSNVEKVDYDSITNSRIEELEASASAKMLRAMDETVTLKKELTNARLRLDDTGFDDEIMILDRYIKILGGEMRMKEAEIAARSGDIEIAAPSRDKSVDDHVTNLFNEMTLSMSGGSKGIIAVSGFTAKDEKESELLDFLNEMAVLEISRFDTLTVVERSRISEIMEEQKLSLSALMDTEKAIEVGNLLSANYILTGSVIEMATTVVVFGRIINTESAEVEAVAQVILPINAEVAALL